MREDNDFNRICEALSFVPANDREIWYKMAMAIKSELGELGFDAWDQWSQQDDSYNARDARDVWKSISIDGGITIATLFHVAKENGWQEKEKYSKPTLEEIAERRRITDERVVKEKAKINQVQMNTAAMAHTIWDKAMEATVDNPYLLRKKISPVSTMKEINADEVALILGYTPNSRGEQLTDRLLVIPIVVGNKLSTMELIDGEGRKAALSGKGTKSGGYWASQRLPEEDSKNLTIVIGEGAITALTANEVTGHLAIAALSSGNLVAVSKIMRERYSTASLVILADLVKTTGKPDPHAIEAAQAVGGLLAIPDFGPNRYSNDKDFNDMRLRFGDGPTHQAVMSAKLVPVTEQIKTVESTNVDSRFAVISAAEFASIEHSSWLIKGIIPKAEIVMVFGPSGSGKSFLVLDFAFAIARGIEWCGRNKVCQDRVVYIAAEAAGGLRKRLVAYAQYHNIKLNGIPLDIIPIAPDLLGGRDVTEVSKSIEQAGLIILDTLACVAAGGDENSSIDMGKVLAHCKMLHESTGAVIMLVHHMGKDMTRGARGWSGIRAAVDAEIEVKSIDHGFQIRMTKLKDSEDNRIYSFFLLPVVVGTDEDGEPISSCVIKSTTDYSRPTKPERTGKWEKNIIKAIKQLADTEDKVHEEAIIDCAVNMEPISTKRDQRKSSAIRAFKKLIEEKYYTVNDGFVLVPDKVF